MEKSISEKLRSDYYRNTLPYASSKKDPAVHKAYLFEDRRLVEEFKADVFKELEIVGHPKAELLWSKAWDMGHANGFSDVYYYADELVELIR